MFIHTWEAEAQTCNSSTPTYTIDLSGYASGKDSVTASRGGGCCSDNNCILFNVTLDSNAGGISIDITGGTGNTYYKIGCSPSGQGNLLGSMVCVTGAGPYEVTVCKPGGNAQTYVIQSYPKPSVPQARVYVTQGCQATLTSQGFIEDSITWSAIDTSYNSSLSCTTGCDTTVVTVSNNFPSYIDYRVTGPASATCLSGTWADTVRVIFTTPVVADITPSADSVCTGDSTVLTASGSGGKAPYTYSWNTGDSTASIYATPGTYIVTVYDSILCLYDTDTAIVYENPYPAPVISGTDTGCVNSVQVYRVTNNPGHTYLWSVSGGTLNSTNDSYEVAIQWPSSFGSATITLTETNETGCATTVNKNITLMAKPSTSPITH